MNEDTRATGNRTRTSRTVLLHLNQHPRILLLILFLSIFPTLRGCPSSQPRAHHLGGCDVPDTSRKVCIRTSSGNEENALGSCNLLREGKVQESPVDRLAAHTLASPWAAPTAPARVHQMLQAPALNSRRVVSSLQAVPFHRRATRVSWTWLHCRNALWLTSHPTHQETTLKWLQHFAPPDSAQCVQVGGVPLTSAWPSKECSACQAS